MKLLIALTLFVFLSSFLTGKNETICPDCLMKGCIYMEIDNYYDQSESNDLLKAVYFICDKRGVKEENKIDLIKANYGL